MKYLQIINVFIILIGFFKSSKVNAIVKSCYVSKYPYFDKGLSNANVSTCQLENNYACYVSINY